MPILDQFSSTNLGLSYIAPAQAQKHVTVNESFRLLDAVVQLSVIDKDLTAPPATPNEGDRYIVAAGANGDWTVQDNNIAAFQDGSWSFHVPSIGWQTYITDENAIFVFDGTNWMDFFGSTDADTVDGIDSTGFFRLGSSSTQSANGNLQLFKTNPELDIVRDGSMSGNPSILLRTNSRYDRIQNTSEGLSFEHNYSGLGKVLLWTGSDLKINGQNVFHVGNLATGSDNVRFGQLGIGGATADVTNALSINTPAALFNNAGADIQIKVNKNTVSDTASFLFQTGFSARAEIGLTGDDDFHFKVSSDGSTFHESIVINKNNGNIGIGKNTPTTKLDVDGVVRIKTYMVAALPSAVSTGAGSMIYISDEIGGAIIAFSDGTDWRRVIDRTVVS